MSKELFKLKESCLATFLSTQGALRAEQELAKNSIDFVIIPTPREISTSCGLAVKFRCQDLEKVRGSLAGTFLEFAIYQVSKEENNLSLKILAQK